MVLGRSNHRKRADGLFGTALVLALQLWMVAASPARAQLPSPFLSKALEVWSGGDATRNVWSIWAGVNWSPFGKIEDDGFRVRLGGGGGMYRYTAMIEGARTSIYGTTAFADVLAGYQMSIGSMTLKVFGGATFDAHALDPRDPSNPVDYTASGAKAVVEAWINLTPAAFAQIDASVATAHEAYWSRLRLGYRVTRRLALGLEAGAFGNRTSDSRRAGVFARYEWLDGEISASGGVSGDIAEPRNAYATVNYLKRF